MDFKPIGRARLALVIRKVCAGDTVLEGIEQEAQEGRKGLLVDPQPVPPWKWRRRKDYGHQLYATLDRSPVAAWACMNGRASCRRNKKGKL